MNSRHDMVTIFVARLGENAQGYEFLLVRRSIGDYLGGTWQLVRGGVEPMETYVNAAQRELMEETSLVPAELYRLSSIESFFIVSDDTLWHSVAFCAIVASASQVRLNEEHDAFRWVADDQLDASLMWGSERQLLPELRRDILGNGLAKPHLMIGRSDGSAR